jgi:5-methylcytosine-specific restriction protein B
MTKEEIIRLVAEAAGIMPDQVTNKEKEGHQIKANSLFEGSCSPGSPRVRAGTFFARDSPELAVEGAVRRMILDVPFPESVVALFDAKANRKARVFGYADSSVAVKLSRILHVDVECVPRPMHVPDPAPVHTLDAENLRKALEQTPNVILQGPPGTGKSSLALELVRSLADGHGESTPHECRFTNMARTYDNVRAMIADSGCAIHTAPVVWEMIQLHPGYSYDDLVRRILPRTSAGGLVFSVEDQLLPKLCAIAEARRNVGPVVLIMDEVNRCNLAGTLGEFIFAIDPNHRGMPIRLQYQGDGVDPEVAAPPNLWLIGTMNTADRSIALVDYAVRRRFRFLDVPSKPDVVTSWYAARPKFGELARDVLDVCNASLSERQKVGHSAFLVDPIPEESWTERFARNIAYQVVPLLAEYAKEGLRTGTTIRLGEQEYDLSSQRVIAKSLADYLQAKIAET